MSEFSKAYKENLFKTLRDKTIPEMETVIENCLETRRILALSEIDIPNIVLAYNNKMILLNKDFEIANIDFFDNKTCETHYAIENYLQSLILIGKSALSRYFDSIRSITLEQAQDFVDSYKKPSTMEKFLKKKKYEPKKCILNENQAHETSEGLKNYYDAYKKLAYFTIQDDIIGAILVYKALSYGNGRDISDRIETIDKEIQQLGYESILPYIKEQEQIQELTLKNIRNIKSVKIKRVKNIIYYNSI